MATRDLQLRIVTYLVLAIAAGAYGQEDVPEYIEKYAESGVPEYKRTTVPSASSGLPIPSQTTGSDETLLVIALPTSDEEKSALRTASISASNSDDLKIALGENSRLLSAAEVPNDDRRLFKLTYYNYDTNRAVEAYVDESGVTMVRARELGFQPPVSSEEISQAIEIANSEHPGLIDEQREDVVTGLIESGDGGSREVRLFPDGAGITGGEPLPSIVIDLDKKEQVSE